MRYRLVLVAMALLTGGARAQTPATPDPALVQHSRDIAAHTNGADGVFQVQDDGTIRHLQSGLMCPASYPNAEFFNLLVYPTALGKGADVGCDYRRPDGLGGANAKFTLFATKADVGTTLDSAFQGYQREVAQVQKDAQPLGPALHVGADAKNLPDFRSEEYLVTWNDRPYTSQLFVTITAGWVIEIRATFAGKPNEVEIATQGGNAEATAALQDRATGAMALFAAISAIGK